MSPAPPFPFWSTWGGGELFSRENLSVSPPPLGGRSTHVGWLGSGGGEGAGPRGGGEGLSTWLASGAIRHLVAALKRHCWELGVSTGPAIPGRGWGPLARKEGRGC